MTDLAVCVDGEGNRVVDVGGSDWVRMAEELRLTRQVPWSSVVAQMD